MGRDKAIMEFQGFSLLDHMVRLLSTVAAPVRIVGREDLPDKVPGHGPLGGIRAARDVSESELNLVVAADLPLLVPEFLKWFFTPMTASPGSRSGMPYWKRLSVMPGNPSKCQVARDPQN